MHCSECRAEILDNWLYCPKCGQSLSAAPTAPFYPRNLIDSMNVGLLFVTQRRRIGYINPAARTLFGIDASREPIGKPFEEFLRHPECVALIQRYLAVGVRPVSDEQDVDVSPPDEIAIVGKDGSPRIYRIQASSLHAGSNSSTGAVFLFQDIDDLRISHRIVSHDLHGAVIPIKGFIRTLLAEEEVYDQEIRREFYTIIEDNADRLTRLIHDLLSVERIERLGVAGIEMNWEPGVDLRKATEEVLAIQRRRTESHRFVLDFEPEEIKFETDVDQLQSILQYLISNAVKYSPDGGEVHIIARLKPSDEKCSCDAVLIGVKDEGVGISESELRNLRKTFHHSPPTRYRKAGGTGMGQFIVKAILEAHKGTMAVESEPGKGATFWVLLPSHRLQMNAAL